jgi:hypothetical protein
MHRGVMLVRRRVIVTTALYALFSTVLVIASMASPLLGSGENIGQLCFGVQLIPFAGALSLWKKERSVAIGLLLGMVASVLSVVTAVLLITYLCGTRTCPPGLTSGLGYPPMR